jgi:hypothetical protein
VTCGSWNVGELPGWAVVDGWGDGSGAGVVGPVCWALAPFTLRSVTAIAKVKWERARMMGPLREKDKGRAYRRSMHDATRHASRRKCLEI